MLPMMTEATKKQGEVKHRHKYIVYKMEEMGAERELDKFRLCYVRHPKKKS